MSVADAPATYAVVDGKVQAPQLELNVVENCNLSCRSCSHLSPVVSKHRVDLGSVERDLSLLGRHYHVETLKMVGGEPLLHPDLISIAGEIRRSGVADRIYLVTNGVLLPRMGVEFWRAFDWVEVSLYPAGGAPVVHVGYSGSSGRPHHVGPLPSARWIATGPATPRPAPRRWQRP